MLVDFYETAATWDKDTIHRQGQVLATDEPVVGVRHAHLDHLGTIRLWTRSDATVHSAHTYTAFGEEVTPVADQELQFTGHERDPYLSEGCPAGVPAIETVDNQTVSTGQTFTGCDEVTSENTDITSTQEVRFEAGDSISLGEDFSVAQGAVFAAEIDASIDSALQDLDYMHARYCSPVQGRFLSVDPIDSSDPKSPQSWNKYTYVMNSPINFIDPTGLYLCSGTQDECGAISAQLAELEQGLENLSESGRDRIQAILDFYGEEGVENGVEVRFGATESGAPAQADYEPGRRRFFGLGPRRDGTSVLTFDLSQTGRSGNLGTVIAHEGSHGVDQQALGGQIPLTSTLASEFRASLAQATAGQALGVETNYRLWTRAGGYNRREIVGLALRSAARRCEGVVGRAGCP